MPGTVASEDDQRSGGAARALRATSDQLGAAEREAERFAESVTAGPAGGAVGRPARISAAPDRLPQRSPARGGPPAAPGALGVPAGAGRPLDLTDRLYFESRLGTSLTGIRLHDGPTAADSARRYGASAFTSGQHIAFGAHQFAPHSVAGRRLLAHELAHVVQQQRRPGPPSQTAVHRQVAVPAPPVSKSEPHNVGSFVLDPALATSSPPDLTTHLRVVDPWAPAPSTAESYVEIERRVRKVSTVRLYAVPLIELYDNPAEASSTIASETPRIAPTVEEGELVWTNQGQFTVTGTAGSLVFSDSWVPEAVGAAVVLLAETDTGSVLVDSGQQLRYPNYAEPLGTEVARRLVALMPVGQIDEAILMPGAPSGHSLPQIALQVAIGTIRATPQQYLDAGVAQTVAAVQRNQAEYRTALETQLRASLAARRAAWEANQPLAPNESIRRQRWQQHLDQVVADTLGQLAPTAALTVQATGNILQLPPGPAPAPADGQPADAILDRSAVNWEPANDELIMVVSGDRLAVLNSRGLLLRPAKPAGTPVPAVRPAGPTGPTPISARPPTPWVAAAAIGKAGQSMVRTGPGPAALVDAGAARAVTGRGPGVVVNAGGVEVFVPDQTITWMMSELGVSSFDIILVTHGHGDHVRGVVDTILEHNIRADRLITSANWNDAGIGDLNKALNKLKRLDDLPAETVRRLVELGYGPNWRPGIAVGNVGVSHATMRVTGGQVDIFTNPQAHQQIRDRAAQGKPASAPMVDSSSLFYVMGNETSPHRVAVLGDLRGADLLRFAALPDGSFQQALTGVRVIIGFGHHLSKAEMTAADVQGYETLFRETLLRNGELTIVVQSAPDFAFGTDQVTPTSTNALLEFARGMGARVVFVGAPGDSGGGAVVRSDLTVSTYGQGTQGFPANEQVKPALERLQLLREASRALQADPVAGPRQLRMTETAVELQRRLAAEIGRLETLLSDLLGRRAADFLDARGKESAGAKAAFRTARTSSGLTTDQILAQLAQRGPLESSLQGEVVEQLRKAVAHGSPLAVEAELLLTPRPVSEAIAQLPQQQRDALERQYREITELVSQVSDGKMTARQHLDLLQRVETLRDDLRRMAAAAPAESRASIEAETRRLDEHVTTLMKDVEVKTETGRDEQGRVTKTEFRTLRKPADIVDKSFARAGQLMGALMVVHSVEDLATSMAGLQAGQINVPETLFSVAHAGYNLNIGLRMVRLAPVHPGEFVVVAALEVGAVLLSDTGTQEERDFRLATVGVEQLCLATGMAVMHAGALLPHPVAKGLVMALGLAITLAGPRVLGWLGLSDWLVRKTSFPPESVTHVYQDIEDTLTEYETIVGAQDLAQRSDDQLRAVGASDPAALRKQAAAAQVNHTEQAHRKELQLIELFRQAYLDAGEAHTGLRNLDAMAARFARLRHVALPGDAKRDELQRDFAAMDPQNALFSNPTPQQVRDMDQWTKLRSLLYSLDNALRASPVKWDPVYEYLDKCHQVLDNARYRVDSAAAGYRPDPMLAKGTPAYDEYVELLRTWEIYYSKLLARAAELAGAGDVSFVPSFSVWDRKGGDPLAAVTLLQDLRAAYDQRVDEAATAMPELAAPEVWQNSNVLMKRLESAHRSHPKMFDRLQVSELALQSSIGQTRTALVTAQEASPALPQLISQETAAAELAIDRRRKVKGLVFPSELDSELTGRRLIEDRTLAARLDAAHPRAGVPATGPRTMPLSELEIIALQSKELSDQGGRMTSTEHQLAKAWELISKWREVSPDPDGHWDLRGHRWERDLMKLKGPKAWKYNPGFPETTDHLDVPAGRAVIVARVGADIAGRTTLFSGPAAYGQVLAITPAAIDLLGTDPVYIRLHTDEIGSLAPGELDIRDPAAAPLPAPPVPAAPVP
ncbi:MAG TPA: DUF4157 domain-containing protein [Jatrophihabitans sp.]|nr:DUF4157 domain-containing protein [Jatrophihabitans sp.]